MSNGIRCYHGWIIAETECTTEFTTHRILPEGNEVKRWGSASEGAAKAVDYFETTLGLGPFRLEPTLLGLRVFREN